MSGIRTIVLNHKDTGYKDEVWHQATNEAGKVQMFRSKKMANKFMKGIS